MHAIKINHTCIQHIIPDLGSGLFVALFYAFSQNAIFLRYNIRTKITQPMVSVNVPEAVLVSLPGCVEIHPWIIPRPGLNYLYIIYM